MGKKPKSKGSAKVKQSGPKKAIKKGNPFESRVQKLKKPILNKKIHGIEINPTKSQSKAFKKRENTLGIEIDRRNVDNTFIDNRFNLNDENLPESDKMLMLYQRKKMEEWQNQQELMPNENAILTHRGHILDEVDGNLVFSDKKIAPVENEKDAQSKKDILKDIIARSKYYKSIRQREKSELQDKIQKVDDAWKEIAAVTLANSGLNDTPDKKDDKSSGFSQLMAEFALGPRAVAKDRLETQEEVEKAEKERLEQLEAERIKRMNKGMKGTQISTNKTGVRKETDENEDNEDDNEDIEIEGDIEMEEEDNEVDGESSIPTEGALPFTFKVPRTYREFAAMFVGQSFPRQQVILERTIKSNPVSMGHRENFKLFFKHLIQHIMHFGNLNSIPYDELDLFNRTAFDVGIKIPFESANECIEKLKKIYEKKLGKHVFSLSELLYLTCLTHLWPISDREHIVLTPAYLLMSEVLETPTIETLNDVISGLFLSQLVVLCASAGGRYTPLPLLYLLGIVETFIPKKNTVKSSDNIISNAIVNFPESLLKLSDSQGLKHETIDRLKLEMINDKKLESTDKLKMSILYTSLSTISSYIRNIFTTSPETKLGISPVLEIAKEKLNAICSINISEKMSSNLKTLVGEIQFALDTQSQNRKSLQLYKRAFVQPKELEPKISMDYAGPTNGIKDNKQREASNLKRKIKAERRGAIRELKHDTQFIARRKMNVEREQDSQRKQKLKAVTSWLQDQRSDQKRLDKLKKRPKIGI